MNRSSIAMKSAHSVASPFMFSTGVENSYPTIEWKGEKLRRDGMELSGHYKRWQEDFDLVKEHEIAFLRYGPPYHRVHLGPGRYDWDFTDETFHGLKKRKIHPIVDLCHFGLPDWLEGFDNDDWPEQFANYAHTFAHRFPWVRLYTPVNEIFTCAIFSGLRGCWNERQKSDRGFVAALRNMCRATILAEEAILKIQPQAVFIQSEATSYYHRGSPAAQVKAAFDNQRRFLALDLCYGQDVSGVMHQYLREHGVSEEDYGWFMEHGRAMRGHCIMGNDYYTQNEHMVHDDGNDQDPSGEILGYYVITHQYFDRYKLPIMHTETNHRGTKEKDTGWLCKQWLNILRLRDDGVPIMGFTWYSLIDQTDWDTALCEANYRTIPCGLFDKDRHPHPVAKAYTETIRQWRDQLPLDSICRDIHFIEEEQ